MFNDSDGPIEHFSWGKFIVEGEEHSKTGGIIVGNGNDIKLIGTEVSPWRRRRGHLLRFSMVAGVLEEDIDVLVIGTGVNGLIKCSKRVRESIKREGINKLQLKKTPEACRIYNVLYKKGKKVALLAHGTC